MFISIVLLFLLAIIGGLIREYYYLKDYYKTIENELTDTKKKLLEANAKIFCLENPKLIDDLCSIKEVYSITKEDMAHAIENISEKVNIIIQKEINMSKLIDNIARIQELAELYCITDIREVIYEQIENCIRYDNWKLIAYVDNKENLQKMFDYFEEYLTQYKLNVNKICNGKLDKYILFDNNSSINFVIVNDNCRGRFNSAIIDVNIDKVSFDELIIPKQLPLWDKNMEVIKETENKHEFLMFVEL